MLVHVLNVVECCHEEVWIRTLELFNIYILARNKHCNDTD